MAPPFSSCSFLFPPAPPPRSRSSLQPLSPLIAPTPHGLPNLQRKLRGMYSPLPVAPPLSSSLTSKSGLKSGKSPRRPLHPKLCPTNHFLFRNRPPPFDYEIGSPLLVGSAFFRGGFSDAFAQTEGVTRRPFRRFISGFLPLRAIPGIFVPSAPPALFLFLREGTAVSDFVAARPFYPPGVRSPTFFLA